MDSEKPAKTWSHRALTLRGGFALNRVAATAGGNGGDTAGDGRTLTETAPFHSISKQGETKPPAVGEHPPSRGVKP